MSETAVSCEGLGKRYMIGERERYRTLRETLVNAVKRSGGRREQEQPSIWALRDVSFSVPKGQVIGIIGHNGAGKSTLLRILARITRPTEGRAVIAGRVGSLLEVGTGFHQELTGRENVFLNGAILGMTRAEIARRFDQIVAFAELEKFLDTPVKRYSTGMYMRLAFAVAAHLEPEILIIDEVLAVGDAAFQKKCLGKMDDVARQGRTALFVSHNLLAVEDLCHRSVWLDRGRIREEGPSAAVVARYLQSIANTVPQQAWSSPASAPGNDLVRTRRVAVRRASDASDPISIRTPFAIEIEYWLLRSAQSPLVSLQLFNQYGVLVFESGRAPDPLGRQRPYPVGVMKDVCHVPGDLLNDGVYRVTLHFMDASGAVIHVLNDVVTFEVADSADHRDGFYGHWGGAVRPPLQWTTTLVEGEER